MHPIEQRLPFFCQPFFCQIELRGWDVAASRNTKFTLQEIQSYRSQLFTE